MDDLVQAVIYIIDRADQFNVDPNNYAVMGFSAGGHLTASYGTKHLGYRKYNLPPPSALILSYAAISMYYLTHKKMKETLMGKNPSEELMNRYSIEKNIDEIYPPTFTWRCEDDDKVQDEHRTALVESLKKFNIKHQSELYSGGKHGINLGIGTDAEKWLKQSLDFWKTASE
jgi:acetyl esterase/lipase